MKVLNHKIKKKIFTLIVIVGFFCSLLIIPIFPYNIKSLSDSKEQDFKDDLHNAYQTLNSIQWLNNPNFNTADSWYSTKGGPNSNDVNGLIDTTDGQANSTILGDERIFSFIEDPPQYSSWTATPNSDVPVFPDTYNVLNGAGCYVSHRWAEGPDQLAAVDWDHNFTMPVNMSHYTITSASLSAVVNATVTVPSYQYYSDGIDVDGDEVTDPTEWRFSLGDSVRFYVLVADLDKEEQYEVAHYQSTTLGQDVPSTPTLSNTEMIPITEDLLIFYLTQVLKKDDYNFTLTLGLRIYCEDNFAQDSDNWNALYINSINLTFTYEKIINKETYISWNQDAGIPSDISENPIQITNATLNFKYKVDKDWVQTTTSTNTRFEIEINGNRLGETILIENSNTTFQEAKVGGIDIKSLIDEDTRINISIKLYIADNFNLAENIIVSIDDVELWISYIETLADIDANIELFLNQQNRTIQQEIQVYLGKSVNVTAIYENISGDFIPNATLQFSGGGILENMTKDATYNQYYINIDTELLGPGDTYCKITASKYTYKTQEKTFKISVLDRYAYIDQIFLNNTDKTSSKSIENLPSGDPLFINVTYIDNLTSSSIDNATVQLYDGINLVGNFTYNSLNQYNFTYDTTGIPKSVKYLTVRAQKDNYSLDYVQLTVVIDAKGSTLITYLNYSATDDISTTINDFVIMNVTYEDLDGDPISGAEVVVNGSGISAILKPYASNDNYSLIIDTNDLIGSINRLDIYAEADGFLAAPATIIIHIGERNTSISVFLNSTTETPISESFSVDYEIVIGETLNITVKYVDYFTGELIVPANMNISIPNLKYYDYLTNVSDKYYILMFDTLVTGVKYGSTYDLIVKASRINYVSLSFTIHLEILPRPTDYKLFLNGDEYNVNETAELSLPYSTICNITIRYLNNDTKVYINGTTKLNYIFNSIEYIYFLNNTIPNYQFYLMDTSSLAPGTTRITLTSSYGNFQPYDVSIRLVIQPIQVEIVSLKGDSIELLTGQEIIIRVYINNTDFNLPITGINVDYSSPFGTGTLTETEVDGIYEVNLGTAQQGLYQIVITVFLGEDYAYSSKTIYISVEISPNDAFLITVIQILATVGIISAIGFSTYIYLYQKILKYPKEVRKVRKFKKKLRKKGIGSIDIVSREKGFSEIYTEKLGMISKSLKGKLELTQTEQYLPLK